VQDIFEEQLEDLVAEELAAEKAARETAEAPGDTGEGEVSEASGECPRDSDEEMDKEAPAEEEAQEEEKGFFKKKTDKKLEALKEKNEELEDRVKRQMAEFDNYRKRTEKEKAAMFEMGAKSVIEKLLPVVDNFERGLQSVSEEEREAGFAAGMHMIYKQLMEELSKIGVVPIEAIGKEFDPNFHNAVMQVESEDFEEGTVAQELLKGYMYRDTVVRHSMVAVAQ